MRSTLREKTFDSFPNFIGLVLGTLWQKVLSVLITIYSLGAIIAVQVILGNIAVGIINHERQVAEEATLRLMVNPLVFCVAFILCLQKDLSALKFVSLTGFIC